MRRTSRTLPILLAGSDYVCSGFGSIQRYDNMFGPSQWNAEDIDDWLAMQRDWGVDGGLRTARPGRGRPAAARGGRGLPGRLPLPRPGRLHRRARRPGRRRGRLEGPGGRRRRPDAMVVLGAAQAIRSSGLGSLEVARALQECGYEAAAERVLDMLAARVHGDHLQTAAIFDESMRVLSLVTDPNDYAGPGHRLRARRGAAGRDRRRSGRPAASRTCARTRRVLRRRLLQGGRPGGPGQRPARGGHRRSRRASAARCGRRCPGCPSSTRCASCSPGSRRRAAWRGSCGSTAPSTSAWSG